MTRPGTRPLRCLLSLLLAAVLLRPGAVPAQSDAGPIATPQTPPARASDRLLVKLRPAPLTARLRDPALRPATVTTLAARFQARSARPLFRDSDEPLSVEAVTTAERLGLDRWIVLELPPGTTPEEAARRLAADPLVETAEPDGIGQGAGRLVPASIRDTAAAAARVVPDDPRFTEQWYLDQASDHDIDMPEAWAVQGSAVTVIVAVLDSGVDLDHPDLAAVILPGRDFVNDDNDPTDDNGHGSNVAGLIGAIADNGIGVAGAAFRVGLLPVKVLGADNTGYYSWWAEGLRWATDRGARVINLSAGGISSSSVLHDAVVYAWERGTVVCVAMMNFNNAVPYYPAAFSETIAVGATDDVDARAVPFFWDPASGSCYGTHIDLVAPGSRLLSTYYNGGYAEYGGTSQATPLVAATAALLTARDSRLLPEEIRQVLQATAQDGVGPPAEDTAGFDVYFGWGRLNAAAALAAVEAGPAPVTRLEAPPPYPNPTSGPAAIRFELPRPELTTVRLYDVRGRRVRILLEGELLPSGPNEVAFDGRDELGRHLASGLYLVEVTAGRERAVYRLVVLR
jgi:thermitase